MKYHVTVGEKSYEVDLSGSRPLVDGVAVDAELMGGSDLVLRLHLGLKVIPIIARPDPEAAGRWSLRMNGRSAIADVIDERTRTIRAVTGSVPIEARKQVLAPMPGLVLRVAVEVGDRVTIGQSLVVVEAMKMENELRASHDGTVTVVHVAAGDTVEKGSVLVVLE